MRTRRFSLLTPLLVAVVALFLMPTLAAAAGSEAAYDEAISPVSIVLTSDGIVVPPSSLSPGDHLLTIVNNTTEPRGLEMTGIDLATSPTIRFTRILQPGESEDFRWFMAPGKDVYLRDLKTCGHAQLTCMLPTFGWMSKSINVD